MPDKSEIARAVRQNYFVPTATADLVTSMEQDASALGEDYKSVVLAFCENLHEIHLMLSLPFYYVFADVGRFIEEQFFSVERVREERASADARVDEDERRARDERARVRARKMALRDSEENPLKGMEMVAERLYWMMTHRERLLYAVHSLNRQGVLLVWSAFEVLARDLFVAYVNNHPESIKVLRARMKRFDEKVDWDTLGSFGFDLSRNVGTLLAQRVDLDDVPKIKDAYTALFHERGEVGEALSDRKLIFLWQRRNLIVHRGGKIDQRYVAATGDDQKLGSQLKVAPADIEQYLFAVVRASRAMTRSMVEGVR